jgi:hypothetical protein
MIRPQRIKPDEFELKVFPVRTLSGLSKRSIEERLLYNQTFVGLTLGEQAYLINTIKLDLDSLELEFGNEAKIFVWTHLMRQLAVVVNWSCHPIGEWKKKFLAFRNLYVEGKLK